MGMTMWGRERLGILKIIQAHLYFNLSPGSCYDILAGMLGLEAWPRCRGQILLASASALASGCLVSVLALVSIIWPRPPVERGQGRGL